MGNTFFTKDSYTVEDIIGLINNQIEESINLDFKAAKSLDKSDGKKREIAKDVSAFANSDGGIIIYGLIEENHKPVKIDFVDGNIYTKEWLEDVIDSNVQQKIHDLRIFPVRIESQISKTVYVVKIPSSNDAPHISADKKYYRRFNFKSVPMEEYEIRLLYNRTSNAEMDFHSFIRSNVTKEKIDDYKFEIICEYEVHIENISKSIEKNCKVEASFLNIEELNARFSYPRDESITHRASVKNGTILTGFNNSPIFPEEIYPILKFSITIDEEEYEEFNENFKIELKMYDSVSIKGANYKANEMKPINDEK